MNKFLITSALIILGSIYAQAATTLAVSPVTKKEAAVKAPMAVDQKLLKLRMDQQKKKYDSMTPTQQAEYNKRKEEFMKNSKARSESYRSYHDKVQSMDAKQRKEHMEKMKKMTPEQRKNYVEKMASPTKK